MLSLKIFASVRTYATVSTKKLYSATYGANLAQDSLASHLRDKKVDYRQKLDDLLRS